MILLLIGYEKIPQTLAYGYGINNLSKTKWMASVAVVSGVVVIPIN